MQVQVELVVLSLKVREHPRSVVNRSFMQNREHMLHGLLVYKHMGQVAILNTLEEQTMDQQLEVLERKVL
jgi:hypothetical protein